MAPVVVHEQPPIRVLRPAWDRSPAGVVVVLIDEMRKAIHERTKCPAETPPIGAQLRDESIPVAKRSVECACLVTDETLEFGDTLSELRNLFAARLATRLRPRKGDDSP